MDDIVIGICVHCKDMFKAPPELVENHSYVCGRCKKIYTYVPVVFPEFALTGIHSLNDTLAK
jgi:hypothetical protein